MTKKINLNFMCVIAVSILLSAGFTAAVSYRMFQKEVFSDLSSFAEVIGHPDLMGQMKEQAAAISDSALRITWIDQDGSVLYDSYAKDRVLSNHGSRPEIMEAFLNGEGSCIRKSQTMEQSIFFYARRLEDGTVIRMAKEAGSIWKIYKNTVPATLAAALLSFLVSMWIAGCLTRALIRPIAQMAENMDHLEERNVYRELGPFLERIRSQHEETLKNAKIRQEFTANVSHELKTPLTSISGYSELIASGMASKEEGQHFARAIQSSAQRLLTLINDILRLSELDDPGAHCQSFELLDVWDAAGHCLEMMKPVAEKHGVILSLEGTSLLVHGDRGLLEELIYNLCDNAVRYNRRGGHVWMRVTDCLTIQDDGIGIPVRYQDRVFERFFRVDKSRSKKTGGTGLGLAIVKHIAEVHHAELSLESDENKGTTVCVRFPE